MDSEDNLDKNAWSKIPTDTDILLTHGPPYGILDKCKSGILAGCNALLNHVLNRIKPLYHIFGHIHEAYGEYKNNKTGTIFVNASICNFRYKPNNEPYVFELPNKSINI